MQRPQKVQKISYCKGVIDPNNISAEVEDVLDRLEDGEHAGLCTEKLRGHNLFSCRLNDADRLLFTYIEHNDAQYLLLLDIVHNHDYSKSFATKRRALSNFIELNGHVFLKSIVRGDFEPVAVTAQNTKIVNDNNKAKRKRVYIEKEYFNYEFITLSADQTKATKVSLPAAVSGVAGGGKSGAAFARITDLAEAMSKEGGDQLPDVCYVTQSKPLCENMQANFEATRRAELVAQGRICFKTYEELMNAKLDPVGFREFEIFVADEIKAHQVRCKLPQSSKKKLKGQSDAEQDKLFSKEFYQNVQAMYQEMRVISGTDLDSDAEYLKLGNKQSLFDRETQRAERVWLYTISRKYLKYLASDKNKTPMIDLGCCPVAVEPRNMICIVDEAQDLSPLQLNTLKQLSKGNTLYIYHKDQSLSDPLGKDHIFNEMTDARHNKSEPIELKSSFRCGESALAAGQVFLDFFATLNHEAKSLMPASEISDLGTLRVITKLSIKEERELQELAASPDCVIITDEKNIEQGRERFTNARQVVAVDEFKGLEAWIIMIAGLLDDEVYAEACEQLLLYEKTNVFCDNKSFGPAFKRAYTACTRVKGGGQLIILQDNPKMLHRIQPIIQRLLKCQKKYEKLEEIELTEEQIKIKSFERVKKLLRTRNDKNNAIAKTIYIDELKKSEKEFNELKSLFDEEKKQPAVTVKAPPAAVSQTTSVNKISKSKLKRDKKKAAKNKTSAAVTNVSVPTITNLMSVAEVKNSITSAHMGSEAQLPLFREYFTNADYHHQLFTIPDEPAKECRFVEYMSDLSVREYILSNIIPTVGETLFRLPNFPFDRRVLVKPGDESTLPPVFWFALNEKLWDILAKNMMTNRFKFTGIVAQAGPGTQFYGMSAFYLLTRLETGCRNLTTIVLTNLEILCKQPLRFFVTPPASALANGRSIIDNLLDAPLNINEASSALSALTVMLDEIHGLGLNITAKHLTTINVNTKKPRLIEFLNTVSGRRFIQWLSTDLNPDLTALGLWKLSPDSAQIICDEMNKTFNSSTVLSESVDRVLVYLNGLIANPAVDKLDRLFANKNAHVYLFCLPTNNGECLFRRWMGQEQQKTRILAKYVYPYIENIFLNERYDILFHEHSSDGECLFVHLLDHEETRSLMLSHLLPQYGRSLAGQVPAHALMRKKHGSGKPDPLIWLCGQHELIKMMGFWLNHDLLVELLAGNAFFKPISIADYKAAKLPESCDIFKCDKMRIVATGSQLTLQPWELLCIDSEGIMLLSCLDQFPDNHFYNHLCLRFSTELKIAYNNSAAGTTLFQMLSGSHNGIDIISGYIRKNKRATIAMTKDNLFLQGAECSETRSGNRSYQGSCALFDLLLNEYGMATICILLEMPYIHLQQSGILKTLFFALTPECIDDEGSIERFISMLEHEQLRGKLTELIIENNSIKEMFDQDLFTSIIDCADKRFCVIECLQNNLEYHAYFKWLPQITATDKPENSNLMAHSLYQLQRHQKEDQPPAPQPKGP